MSHSQTGGCFGKMFECLTWAGSRLSIECVREEPVCFQISGFRLWNGPLQVTNYVIFPSRFITWCAQSKNYSVIHEQKSKYQKNNPNFFNWVSGWVLSAGLDAERYSIKVLNGKGNVQVVCNVKTIWVWHSDAFQQDFPGLIDLSKLLHICTSCVFSLFTVILF